MNDYCLTLHTRCYSDAAMGFLKEALNKICRNYEIYYDLETSSSISREEDGEIVVSFWHYNTKCNSNDSCPLIKKSCDIAENTIGRYICKFITNEYVKAWILNKTIIPGGEETIGHPLNPFEIESRRIISMR